MHNPAAWVHQARRQLQQIDEPNEDEHNDKAWSRWFAEPDAAAGPGVAMLDKHEMDEPWRPVFVSARFFNGEAGDEYDLLSIHGAPVDEPPETPGGVLTHASFGDTHYGLEDQYGMYYKVPSRQQINDVAYA